MRNILIIGLIVTVAVAILYGLFGQEDEILSKTFDERFTLSNTSYKPYDIQFFFDEIKKYASKGFELNETPFDEQSVPLHWDTPDKLLMVISPYFFPNNEEIQQMKTFVSKGNYAFISAFSLSPYFLDSLYYSNKNYPFVNVYPPKLIKDSLKITWLSLRNQGKSTYSYPGHSPVIPRLDSIFLYKNHLVTRIDTLIKDKYNRIQMLEMTCGKGRLFLTINPLIFSNYFLLHQQNYAFFNQIAQRIELNKRTVVWDNFYKKFARQRQDVDSQNNDSYFLELVHKHPPLTWAFYTFLAGISLFIGLYWRRIQAPMAVLPMIENHSLAFVNVVSGLYWQQQNHQSIANKMIAHFYENLASQHRIFAKDFEEKNAEIIAQKTGKKIELIQEIMAEIKSVEAEEAISAQQLTDLYKHFYLFYHS